MTDLAPLDIFLPAPAADPQAQEDFLDEAGALALDGQPITVYVQGEDDWAFEACDPVRELLEVTGPDALPITLMGGEICASAAYPSAEKMKRLAATGPQARDGRSAAASACGPMGAAPVGAAALLQQGAATSAAGSAGGGGCGGNHDAAGCGCGSAHDTAGCGCGGAHATGGCGCSTGDSLAEHGPDQGTRPDLLGSLTRS